MAKPDHLVKPEERVTKEKLDLQANLVLTAFPEKVVYLVQSDHKVLEAKLELLANAV